MSNVNGKSFHSTEIHFPPNGHNPQEEVLKNCKDSSVSGPSMLILQVAGMLLPYLGSPLKCSTKLPKNYHNKFSSTGIQI